MTTEFPDIKKTKNINCHDCGEDMNYFCTKCTQLITVLSKIKERENKKLIMLHIKLLVHASKCGNIDCPSNNCRKMKTLLMHGTICEKKAKGGCLDCRQIWTLLLFHARGCREPSGTCYVPKCEELKEYQKNLLGENY